MNALEQVTALRKQLWHMGYRPVPVCNWNTPGPSPGKRPLEDAWQIRAQQNPPDAASRDAEPGLLNTGILCNGLRALDIDFPERGEAAALRALAIQHFGDTITRTRQNSGKLLMLYRAAAGEPRKRAFITTGDRKVEVLGHNNQFVAFCTHETRVTLDWRNGKSPATEPFDFLPEISEEQVSDYFAAVHRLHPGSERSDIKLTLPKRDPTLPISEQVTDALAKVTAMFNGAVDRHGTMLAATAFLAPFVKDGDLDYGVAVDTVSAGMESAGRAPNLGEVERGLDGALAYDPRSGVEFKGIPAHPADPDEPIYEPDDASADHEQPADDAPDDEQHTDDERADTWAAKTLQLIHPADCATGPRRAYLIKHLLAAKDVAAIIGAPGAGKSMLAPYLAYAVAQGREVFGLRTKQGRTLYVAAEDGAGLRQRIHALRLQHGDAADFAMAECGNLRVKDVRTALRNTVALWKPALIVIDTLGAAWAGLDENSSKDMGDVVALARQLARTGAAVVLVHHTPKHGDGTPRGHSVLNGTLDMCLKLEPKDQGGVIRGTLSKNRNGTTDRAIAFRFNAVELGQDEDGDVVTAPMAVELAASEAARPARMSDACQAALRTLQSMVADNPDTGGKVDESAWRARCDDERTVSTADNPDSRARAFRRAFADLVKAGLVCAGDGQVWPISGPDRGGQTRTNPGKAGPERATADAGWTDTANASQTGADKPGQAENSMFSKAGQARTSAGQDRTCPPVSDGVGRTDTDRGLYLSGLSARQPQPKGDMSNPANAHQPAGHWRDTTPDEVHSPGLRYDMDQTTGVNRAWVPAASREDLAALIGHAP